MALYSRYAKHALISPTPQSDSVKYFEFVQGIVKQRNIRLIIPTTDADLPVLEERRDALERLTRLALPSSAALRQVVDKRANLELARELGIPCPRQYELESVSQIPDMIEALGLPIVMKPSISQWTGGQHRFKVLYAHSGAQLRQLIDEHCDDGDFPLFQECAVGIVQNCCCFAVKGEIVAIHQYHSVRRHHGLGVLRTVVELTPDIERHVRAMIAALKWDGVAHTAFFVGQNGDRLWYMETNARLWASVQGAVNAGWDFPYWIYRYFGHGEAPDPDPIRVGSQTCWHLGDLEALQEYLRGGEVPATGTHPSRLRAFLQYLSGFNPKIHSDVYEWKDPKPAIMEHATLFRRALPWGLRKVKAS